MDNQTAKENSLAKPQVALPIIAILIEIFPFIFSLVGRFTSLALLMMLILPVVGFILGVVSLRKGKAKTGMVGKIIAIVAVALPALWIGAIIIFFVGANTGMIALM